MKNTIKLFKQSILLTLLLTSLFSCVDTTIDDPPIATLPFNPDMVVTIGDLKQKYVLGGEKDFTIEGDSSLYAIVTGDDGTGNLYKTAIFQDSTGGITGFNNGSGLFIGDSVRVYLKGVTISSYHQLMQLQNFSMENNIVKIDGGVPVSPKVVTIEEINNNLNSYQSTLVKIEGVQFIDSDLGLTYADAENFNTKNRTLIDGNGNTILVRTSGYADFANVELPTGNGSITAILGRYDSDAQLLIRSVNDVVLDGVRNSSIIQGFEDGFGDWTPISVTGDQEWEIISYGNPGNCAKMTGHDGGNYANEDWLVSPEIDLTDATASIFKFETAKNYTGNILEVFISTDYAGDPTTATWTPLQVTLSSGSWTWTPSGNVDLADYLGNKVHIAYKFTSTSSGSATWEVDNILITIQ